ncbi:hypothetical protein M378DRAFT_169253 [Amanita muscaria Koide BX008]|uniref:Uncharacterized protein n=1 Tax=Amanita muscaria (strain Koide BX008) TaxID=946122 RepID=A0A0C2WDL5_AMAMK|nr:hypothetical protein M378DRAFT_169253 [Amanita muscaria Koide BX008]
MIDSGAAPDVCVLTSAHCRPTLGPVSSSNNPFTMLTTRPSAAALSLTDLRFFDLGLSF